MSEPLNGKRPDGTKRLAEIEPEQVRWLWPRRVPSGKITLVDGDPGLGKSWLTIDIAARATRGAVMPDDTGGHIDPMTVLLVSYEDGTGDTLRPRCEAAGADLDRVVVLDPDKGEHLDLTTKGLARVEELIKAHDVKLANLDPLMACLPADRDSHKDQDIRAVLSRLASVAERHDCAFLIVRHLNKASGRSAVYRGGGSIGIVGQARAAHLVAKDPDDEDARIFAPVKSNLCQRPPALRFKITGDPPKIEWLGEVDETADELLAEERGSAKSSKSKPIDRARGALEEILGGGPVLATDARKRVALLSGACDRTISSARKGLVRTFKTRGVKDAPWYWELALLPPSQNGPVEGGSGSSGEGDNNLAAEKLPPYQNGPVEGGSGSSGEGDTNATASTHGVAADPEPSNTSAAKPDGAAL